MSMPIIPLPDVWDIPVAVGVPALLGQSIGRGVRASASTAAGKILENWTVQQAAQQWGIFSGATKVLSSSHVSSVEFGQQYRISNAPVEDGSFTSYNKVKQPYNALIEMICDGSETGDDSILQSIKALSTKSRSILGSDDVLNGVVSVLHGGSFDQGLGVRQSFLHTLSAVTDTTNIYQIVTPEAVYPNANITGYRFVRRTQSGVTMIIAQIEIQEVRQTATSFYKNTKEPSGATLVQRGTVQTMPLSKNLENTLTGVKV